MRAPSFWDRDGVTPRLLAPLSWIYADATARRMARPGWRAPVPVICCGNATAGGAGKTTLALELGARLRGRRPAFLTRGYGGRLSAPVRVDPAVHDAGMVGDEALLLAGVAPTFVARDRAASARMAVAGGAGVLIMDDGLQNPSLQKDCALLVVDGASGFGNGRVIPAGPLRETVASAASRCRAAVLVGDDLCGAAAMLPPGLPVLRARLQSPPLAGRRFLAFAGIGRPEKFFATLEAAGAVLAGRVGFADHHAYRMEELEGLLARARALGAVAATTPKDAMRLPLAVREQMEVIGVRMIWQDEAALDALLETV